MTPSITSKKHFQVPDGYYPRYCIHVAKQKKRDHRQRVTSYLRLLKTRKYQKLRNCFIKFLCLTCFSTAIFQNLKLESQEHFYPHQA